MNALLNLIDWLRAHPWILTAIIAIVGLGLYGLRDLLRLSPRRIWTIGGVCFRDAIRRRVLLITPLAMLGIIIVSQLQRPIDEADAIRLTIKFCFFATALVVTVIALITAATNLQREIESRVIYTIVTKPVTRMEIAIGKLVGFARVSAAILLIMGVFSLGYLHLRAWYLEGQLAKSDQPSSAADRARTHGLLFAQSVSNPQNIQQYARLPDGDTRWLLGGAQQATVDFDVPENAFVLAVELRIPYAKVTTPSPEAPADSVAPPITVQVLKNRSMVFTGDMLRTDKPDTQLPPVTLTDAAGTQPVLIDLPLLRREQLTKLDQFTLQVMGGSPDHLFGLNDGSVRLMVVDASDKILPLLPVKPPQLNGSEGRSGQELRGPSRGEQSVAILQFRGVDFSDIKDGKVPFEMMAGVEASGDSPEDRIDTNLEIVVRDPKSNRVSDPVIVNPESRRLLSFSMPADYVRGGDFDLLLRNPSDAQVVELTQGSIGVVSDREYFGINLFKGLLVLWLFAILTASIALCCSTFLSWPIAVMLTLLVILCRWGVSNLDLSAGLGRQIANEGGLNPNQAPVVESVVAGLTKTLGTFASLLPDIAPFGVTEQIEHGLSVSMVQLFEPLSVLLLFGIPLLTFTYVFLRNKEVAP